MNEMFTRQSKLSGLLKEKEPNQVSHTIHRAFIEKNDGGTESCFATGNMLFDYKLFITI